ncbi:MAG TPA: thiamine pyrophosphate-dependent dehydrogenase E1 component subunit alpha [Stellaceae bacterium]|nr:thiamine pyrophosphate-dependent dehydrogenase E1 component subunit alpha [Stellaceae bacterium]
MQGIALLRAMLLIRTFEAALTRRRDHGFQLLSEGQEAVAVGLCSVLGARDQLLTSGRSIAPALARGLEPGLVMAELLGKAAGPCRGKGGRGHLAQRSAGFFGAHAVVAGNISIAAGVALAQQQQEPGTIVACLFGDGACGAGALHETLNIAALWRLPLLFVCDNNGYSVSTPRSEALAPESLSDLAAPFGIPAREVDGMDVVAVRDAAQELAERTRSGGGPSFLECRSERFASHSTAVRETRSAEEMRSLRKRCPIAGLAARLEAEGILAASERKRLEQEVERGVEEAIRFAEDAPYPDPSEAVSDVI